MNLEKNLSAINSSVFSELSEAILSHIQNPHLDENGGGGVLRMKRVKKSSFLKKLKSKA
ncbi:hypothetical protein [Campylobacter upsaliensis]|uniref:Enoyl-CoA hydratase n=1 Tax=Campylobacter upsaliensis JV21 TaxID=888826 RepID=A0A828QY62_CAMUP|nr:hypothetical protein [Campylobacter upsaliensis]EFU71970.1 enoyl-CoA hydratase [Campylobacter upsaliensis JV21]QMU02736.1 hypothetical protein FOC44_06560 [Campylobacter upsaliensis]